jgi:hypothetical protein
MYNLAMRSLYVLTLLFATAPVFAQTASNPDVIVAQENAFWKAYISADSAGLSNLLLSDFTNVEQELWSRNQVLEFVKQFHEHCSLAPVKILDPRVIFLSPDVATIVYHATESPTCGARTMSGDTNISTVWVRREGRWQMQLHTENAVSPK